MPPIGLVMGGVDFSQLKVVLKPAAGKAAEVAILYGAFINTIIQFLIIGFTVFLMVKMVNAIRRLAAAQEQHAPAAPTPVETLLIEIRDLSSHANRLRTSAHQKGLISTKRS